MRRLLIAAALTAGTPAAAAAEDAAPGFTASLFSVVIRTAEPHREVAFYRDVLGMRLLMERDLGTKREHMLSFGGDPAQPGILLVSSASTAPKEAQAEGQGATRMILHISSLEALAARLDKAKVTHTPIREVGQGFRVMHLADPDHNDLELVQGPPS